MYENYFFDLYGTLVDIWTDERKLSLWRGVAEFYSLCGAPYTPAEIHKRYLALCAEETELLAASKGVKRTLTGLHQQGARLYLLSNAQSCFTIPELRSLGLLDGIFDGIYLSSDFGSKKPFPAFFNAALAQAGLSSTEVLMVGNDPTADIRGADSVGMKSRYIHSWQSPPRGFTLPESCREILSLEELLKDS